MYEFIPPDGINRFRVSGGINHSIPHRHRHHDSLDDIPVKINKNEVNWFQVDVQTKDTLLKNVIYNKSKQNDWIHLETAKNAN